MTILLSWIGTMDLKLIQEKKAKKQGAIARVTRALSPRRVFLLNDYGERGEAFARLLEKKTGVPVELRSHEHDNPMDFAWIYRVARAEAEGLTRHVLEEGEQLFFNTSSGTWAMSTVWFFLSQMMTITPSPKLMRSSIQEGVVEFTPPFAISADFLPERHKQDPDMLSGLLESLKTQKAFEKIVRESDAMREVVAWASKFAEFDETIIITGESGTGKELFARAIHQASHRREGPFLAVNCGAIPENLVESLLFGHIKGAFTGADKKREGVFEQARGGTLFLDEIGELPPLTQVKLLRVLQAGTIQRVGDFNDIPVDVRIVCATHRDLRTMVREGEFREDLYYRLQLLPLELPPLRHRGRRGVRELIEVFRRDFNQHARQEMTFTPEAMERLLAHPWPGNVRELEHTVRRLMIMAQHNVINAEDVGRALLKPIHRDAAGILNRPLEGFDLEACLNEVRQHYIQRALSQEHGKVTRASTLLGIKHYQTLTRLIDKLGINTPS